MTDIGSIKASLHYHDYESSKSAYESWFTVVAILADAYADAGMLKEEVICRWIVRKEKRPDRRNLDSFWWWSVDCNNSDLHSILPLTQDELHFVRLYRHDSLRDCLDRLLLVSDKYLERFV